VHSLEEIICNCLFLHRASSYEEMFKIIGKSDLSASEFRTSSGNIMELLHCVSEPTVHSRVGGKKNVRIKKNISKQR
jgi:hypothetical protein